MNERIHVCIMAGGAGKRFWPLSTEENPKQFLDLTDAGRSLLQLTYDRAVSITLPQNIWVLTNDKYKEIVWDQLPELTSENILCEPIRKDTAPAIAYAAFKLKHKDPTSIMIILSSDHFIAREGAFIDSIHQAIDHVVQKDAIVTLGIQPDSPHTGFGYIQCNKEGNIPFPVIQFVEKPKEELAVKYLNDGNYLWNAGIFIWSTERICKEFGKYAPEIFKAFDQIDFEPSRELEFVKLAFQSSPAISIDFAIMEKVDQVYTIPVDIGWSDLGTWSSLYEIKSKDRENNVIIGKGNLITENMANSIVKLPDGKNAIIRGLENYIVVWEENGLLIYPKDEEQNIKEDLNKLKLD